MKLQFTKERDDKIAYELIGNNNLNFLLDNEMLGKKEIDDWLKHTPEDCAYLTLELNTSPEGLGATIKYYEEELMSFTFPDFAIPHVINFLQVYMNAYNRQMDIDNQL